MIPFIVVKAPVDLINEWVWACEMYVALPDPGECSLLSRIELWSEPPLIHSSMINSSLINLVF